MKNLISFLAVSLVGVILIVYRCDYPKEKNTPLKVTTYDAFGYYMYLPSTLIYDDATQLKWLDKMDSTYSLSGGLVYQANKYENGNYVFKYLGGVALLQTPLFLVGHTIAKTTDYPADGFSAPYQYSIAFGAVFYVILALFLLRRILLRYYSDRVTTITILLLAFATNLIQYVSIDSGQSHAFIFPLYVLILYVTIKWHEAPKIKWAALIGLIIGVATISRPTEAIMLFIPLLWGMQSKSDRSAKWSLVKKHRAHVIYAIIFGLIGVLPQLIYWKMTSGSFIYNVGSKWFFLTPWFRVLFGFTNGWFIYTPITILFIVGFFFMKKYPFKRSVIVFCLLNIWIIIAWSDWQYGATYSTRAMVQSYPVFALAFGAIIQYLETIRWKYVFYTLALYLTFVNFFQIDQYNKMILHYRDMNFAFYKSIYLNSDPSPLDMSLLDTDEFLSDESKFESKVVHLQDKQTSISGTPASPAMIATVNIQKTTNTWAKIEVTMKSKEGFTGGYLHGKLESASGDKEVKVRLNHALAALNEESSYAFYMKLPQDVEDGVMKVFVNSWEPFSAELISCEIKLFE